VQCHQTAVLSHTYRFTRNKKTCDDMFCISLNSITRVNDERRAGSGSLTAECDRRTPKLFNVSRPETIVMYSCSAMETLMHVVSAQQ